MLETLRFESRRQLKGTIGLVAVTTLYIVFLIFFFKQLDPEALATAVDTIPPTLLDAFGVINLSTIEGWLAAEVYHFVWIWALGIYFAYVAAGLIAGDIEYDRMDLLLLFPISRSRLLVEKFASLLLPISVVNGLLFVIVYATVKLFGESVDPIRLLMAHLFSIPYLLTCAAIGIGISVLFDRAAIAQRVAIAVMVALQLIGFAMSGTRFEWIAYISPRYYYDPSPILIQGEYNFVPIGILILATVLLIVASQYQFYRRDIE